MDKRRFDELFPEPEKKEKGAAGDGDPAFFIHMKQSMCPAEPWQLSKSDNVIPRHGPVWKRHFIFSSTAAACLIVALMLPHISGFLRMSEDTGRVDVITDAETDETDAIEIQDVADNHGSQEESPEDRDIDHGNQNALTGEEKETENTQTNSTQQDPVTEPDKTKDIEKPDKKQPNTEKENINKNQSDTKKENINKNQSDTKKENIDKNQSDPEKENIDKKQSDTEKEDRDKRKSDKNTKKQNTEEPDESDVSNHVTDEINNNKAPVNNSQAVEETVTSDQDDSFEENSAENDQPVHNIPCDTADIAVDDAADIPDSDDNCITDISDDEVDEDMPEHVYSPYRYLYLPYTGYWYVCCEGSDVGESSVHYGEMGKVFLSNEKDLAGAVQTEAIGNLDDSICIYITFLNQGNACYYRYEKLREQ